MIDEVVDTLRCLSDCGSCGRSTRWYGRTRPVRILLITHRILRRLCILLGLAGLVLLASKEAPWPGAVMIGIAVAIPVITVLIEFHLIGRGLMTTGPVTWPPRDGTSRAVPGVERASAAPPPPRSDPAPPRSPPPPP
ncbi:hypothetical protein [Muricoccus radiodurans]|uniref:hypothetical protein n=1 Tax=Muricoccus radiodurans TaxID=2231721 RepID=UPI003CF6CB3A